MVGAPLAFARLEIVRFLRRRETFWIFLAIGSLLAAPYLIWAFGPIWFEGEQIRKFEIARNDIRIAEWILLPAMTYFLSFASLRRDMDDGSFALLRQAAAPAPVLVLGKALGLAVISLAFHSYCSLFVLGWTPFIRRPHLHVLAEYLVVWLFAVGFIPEGLVAAQTNERANRSYVVFRILSVARFVILVVLLGAMIRPEFRAKELGLANVLGDAILHLNGREALLPSEYFGGTLAPLAAILGTQLAIALVFAGYSRRLFAR